MPRTHPTRGACTRTWAARAEVPTARLGAVAYLPLVAALIATIPDLSVAQALQFNRTDYPVASGPRWGAIADLNGDGHPDFVVADQGSAHVTIWYGDGNGGFSGRSDLPAGDGAVYVATADLDGNGLTDLVVANLNASTISVLLNQGGGVFSHTDYATGISPLSVAIADFNADGRPDILVGNYNDGTMSIFTNTGGGVFSVPITVPVGPYPYAIAVGDLNRDGKPDVVTANYYAGTVSVLLGMGGTSFGPIATFGTGSAPTSVAIGDLDGDGNPDVLVANSGSNTVSVLRGTGTGGFTLRTDYPTGLVPVTAVIGDMNHDTRPDVVVTSRDSKYVGVLTGNTSGGFDAQQTFATGNLTWGVSIGDFNGDGSPDLMVTNYGDNTASVLLQPGPDTRQPTSTTLASDTNPSAVGQTVTLTATVSPAAATGAVQFVDGATTLGSVSLNAGTASLATSKLTSGVHTIMAVYGGDASYRPSTSAPLAQTVQGLASATAISSSQNPSEITQAVSFTATVSAPAPGPNPPAGLVQFQVDGTNFGAPASLVSGQAVSGATYTLAPGSHTVQAFYLGDGYYLPSTSPTLAQVVDAPNPVIVGVRDVPNDQGGRVFLTWRCKLDQPGLTIVTGYRVWRRAPSPTAAARARGRVAPGRTSGALVETFWEAIATLPSEQLVSYAFTAPTTQDSMLDSNPYTAFFVSALTADPFTSYQSAPDSGYSVDNLAPPTPAPFSAVYGPLATTLHWGTSPAPDLGEFRLYRGLSPDFVPGPGSLIATTRDTSYVDGVRAEYVYKLEAVDIHGNASRYAMVTPSGPVAILASLARITGSPDEIRITWDSPANPGMAATVYRRSDGSDWTAIASITADVRGDLSYDDTQVTTGKVYGYRLGIVDGGVEAFVGEAWALADRQVFLLEGVRPNPSLGGELVVRFSLPSAQPARLELIDIGGRRLAALEVGGLGLGTHAVNLASGLRLAPGIYLVRLSQAGHEQVTRAAVIR